MKNPFIYLSILMFFMLFISVPSYAEEAVLRVGIKPSEPWVMYDASVSEDKRVPEGFSIDLWNEIAKNLGVKTE